MARQILIAVDNSDNADHALNYYLTYMYREGENITLLHISEPPHLPALSFGTPFNVPHEEWAKIMSGHNKKEADIEEKYTSLLRNAKLPANSFKYVMENEGSSSVGQHICEYAMKNKMDLVVVASRGLNTLRRTFMGSTSDYVLHHLGSPVLIVPKQ